MNLIEKQSRKVSDFERLYDEHYDKVYIYIFRRVNNPHDAQDLTADVFLKAFANPYNPDLAKFSTYVYMIAANLLKNHYRNSSKSKEMFICEEYDENLFNESDILKDLINREEYADLAGALVKLSERHYETVYRRYYLEQPFKEIGAALGVSEDAAKKLHKRALDSLKNVLQKERPFLQPCVYTQTKGGDEHYG
ncbi:MAG: RNA polymerase sigma factor [Oscillospiraceae bacterium]|nr:RNA polymerase sigma factor [Oscillospiraceae bacterium]